MHKISVSIFCILLTACQSAARIENSPPPDSLSYSAGSELREHAEPAEKRIASPAQAAAQAGASTVHSFEQVIERIAAANPTFQSYEARIRAADALIHQVSLLPNPELESEVEEFGGDTDGFSESETSIAIVQPLLLGGKISARTELARREKLIEELEAAQLLTSILSDAKSEYANVVYAQSALAISEEQLPLAKEALAAAARKLDAGAVLAVESTNAEISLRNAEVERERFKTQVEIAKESLSALWQGRPSEIGDLSRERGGSELEALLKPIEITASPVYQSSLAKLEATTAQVEVERSLAVPDARFGLGYKRFEQSETDAFLGVFSIGLPVFNRNQGGIEHARQNVLVAKLDKENLRLNLDRQVRSLQSSLRALMHERRVIEKRILPQAKKAYQQARTAYSQGRSGYLGLLNAQQTLLRAKLRKIEIDLSTSEIKTKLQDFSGFTMKQALKVKQ